MNLLSQVPEGVWVKIYKVWPRKRSGPRRVLQLGGHPQQVVQRNPGRLGRHPSVVLRDKFGGDMKWSSVAVQYRLEFEDTTNGEVYVWNQTTEPNTLAVCTTCGKSVNFKGAKVCNNCWEVELRIERYLESPGGRVKIWAALKRKTPDFSRLKV